MVEKNMIILTFLELLNSFISILKLKFKLYSFFSNM